MDVQIQEVTTLKELKAFIHFPFTHLPWQPLLGPDAGLG